MVKDVVLSSAYLPPVSYFTMLYSSDKVFIERHDHYTKQTYRNRCVIASSDGPLPLTIPVEKPNEGKCAMKDIRMSGHGNWRHVHLNALVAAYKQSPFFDYYIDELAGFYKKKYEFLYDFNLDLTRWLCGQVDIQTELIPTSNYVQGDNILDLREVIHPKHTLDNVQHLFALKPYYQVFETKNGFIPDLSVADLLFNMGPESLLVLKSNATGSL